MKKILFYFNSMTPAGGIERVIATLANKFSETMEVTILVKDRAYSHYPLNSKVKILSLDNEIKFNMNNKLSRVIEAAKNFVISQRKLKAFLRNNNFDYYYIAHPLNALEFHFAKGMDSSVIVTEQGGIDAYNIVYKKLKNWLYKKARYYCVPTKTDTAVYKNMGFNAVYVPHFKSQLKYEKSTLDNKIALSIGRMTEAKRQWILIDLWNIIVNQYQIKDWRLHLVGEGNLKNIYIQKIKDLKLENYITILPPKKQVEDYYIESSLFLLSSESEGFGMVILEAMGFGLPCISYDSPSGPRDMIVNGENGFLIPYDDFVSLEKSTLQLIQNSEMRKNFGNTAYEDAKKWDDEFIMKKWKEILN